MSELHTVEYHTFIKTNEDIGGGLWVFMQISCFSLNFHALMLVGLSYQPQLSWCARVTFYSHLLIGTLFVKRSCMFSPIYLLFELCYKHVFGE